MKHTEIALRRPVTTVMFFLALALVGLLATKLLPLEKLPDIEFPGIFIQVPYQGSTPEEVEELITRPIEEALATLPGVKEMRSTSTENMAQIFLQFDWEQEVSAKGIDARAKVDAIRDQLPADVTRVLVFTGSTSDQPMLTLRVSSDRDLSDSYEMLDRLLKRRIERLEGVARTELQGVEPKEIRILMDSNRLAAHGVDINTLLQMLEKSNFSVSAGRITQSGQRLSVRPRGEFTSLEQIRDLAINDQNLRLRDVATVEMRGQERNYGRHLDRNFAIGLNVYKATGANMVEVADRVKEEVAKIGELPQMRGIKIFDLDNQAENVKDSLNDLLSAGAAGALLAIVVLYLFLRQVTTTLIVAASVPFSLLITLGVMYFTGLTLNILSMMGLMLGVGMLVDNAVVVTESVFRQRQKDPDNPIAATLKGVNEVGLAVIAGTSTSIIVFTPIMFGAKVDITVFLSHVAITIIVALVASLLIAQTLVPMLAARVPPPPEPKQSNLMQRASVGYMNLLRGTQNHPWWTTLGILVVVGTSFIPMQLVHFDAFPQESSRRLFMDYHIEGQHSLETMETAVNKVEEFLFNRQEELNIASVYSYFDLERAQMVILLTDEDVATLPTKEVIKRIEEDMPEIIIGKPSFKFDQDGGGSGFSIQLMGDSTAYLNQLTGVEGLKDLRPDSDTAEREIRVSVDRDRAEAAGLTTREVASAIAVAMRGQLLREYRGESADIPVRLAFREDDKQSVEHLADLPLYNRMGERVALGTVASFHIAPAAQAIRRVDRQTAVVISGNLADETGLDEIRPKVEAVMETFELPPGYSWKFGRGFQREDETQQIMVVNILLGIALIFIVMAALFESMLYPLSIITSIGFSVIGVFWFFAATGTTFSFMASIGIMILIGVVVNNGIVLVDHINNLRKEGMARNEAIVIAGRDRLRPILMTVATTILGLAPLAIGTTQVGGDGPPYYPMARAIIGGLGFSTIISLVVVPTTYIWLDGLSKWGSKVMLTARQPLGWKRSRKAG
jgi:HAE1 family hydrophobic/amphiphilic exporter-1